MLPGNPSHVTNAPCLARLLIAATPSRATAVVASRTAHQLAWEFAKGSMVSAAVSRSSESSVYLRMLKRGRELRENQAHLPELRMALLADHATQQLTFVLKAAIAAYGYFPFVYEAEYGTAAAEAYDADSGMYKARPEVVFLSSAVQKYRDRFFGTLAPEDRERLPDQYLEETIGIVDAIIAAGPKVIVSNLALPLERMFGNYAVMTRQSLYGSVLAYNSKLVEAVRSRKGCQINDVMYLASRVGGQRFFDERLWAGAKYLCASQFLPEFAASVATAITAAKGRATKCVVVDLDNTIWGGIVGDDGKEGISLGGDAYGEAFALFQRYLLSLKARGYVLAVCSKNDEKVALDAFRNHPEMVLKEDDVAVFVANWNDKASNLEYIARVLNLGLESFVFVDDSPFERELVRAKLPSVAVPEMPEDVTDYILTLENSGLFEATGYSHEDTRRSQMYREEAQRTTAQIRYNGIDDYLNSLDMQIDCGPFRSVDLPRIAQLIQRSNQFNLRTQRLAESDCERLMLNVDGCLTVQARLRDRYGDYGLIAAICCEEEARRLVVRELVMSCRVLKRGVEDYLMNHLFNECRIRGLSGVQGEYIRSPKNAMVREFFAQFGFQLIGGDEVRQTWFLSADDYQTRKTFIRGWHHE